jgi:hypothetical protein
MATATTKTAPTTEIPYAQEIREQLLSTVRQGQQLTVSAAQAWAKAVAAIPTPDLPKIPGVPALPSVPAVSTFAFDLFGDLLNAQRDFVLELTNVLVPEPSV